MAKTVSLESFVVYPTGEIEVRLAKRSSDGDVLGQHLVSLPPDKAAGDELDRALQNLQDEGFVPPAPIKFAQVFEHTVVAHTVERAAAFRKAREDEQAKVAKMQASIEKPVDEIAK